jgi:hypothetical protein
MMMSDNGLPIERSWRGLVAACWGRVRVLGIVVLINLIAIGLAAATARLTSSSLVQICVFLGAAGAMLAAALPALPHAPDRQASPPIHGSGMEGAGTTGSDQLTQTHPRSKGILTDAIEATSERYPGPAWTEAALVAAVVVTVVAVVAGVAVFTGDRYNDEGGQSGTTAPSAASDRLNLKGSCPDTVVVQTDWDPESASGAYYHMLGPNPQVDKTKKRITGPLVAEGQETGVKLEIRAGGPSIGFEPVTSQLYQDPKITLGQISTDEAIRTSDKQPTLAVVAPMEISPSMIMWDPKQHPQFNIIADIGQTDTKVLYFQGDTYMEYLLGAGILRKSQVNGNWDGSPNSFVASGGKIAQTGFATSEPYFYQHEVPQWGKPVKYALVNDTGYPMYPQALSIRAGDKDKLAPCLKKLVPIVQRAQIDFLKNPNKTNELILELVNQYNTGWVYSKGLADYAVGVMKAKLVNNGPDKTLGNFETSRVQRMIDIVTPIFVSQEKPPKAGLKPADIATNEFVDMSIGITR